MLVPDDVRDGVDAAGVVPSGEHRPRPADGAGRVEALELGERHRRRQTLSGERLGPDGVKAVEREVIADLHAPAGLADLAPDAAAQAVPERLLGAEPFEAIGVLKLEPVARPVERQRVEHRRGEVLHEGVGRRQGRLEGREQLVLLAEGTSRLRVGALHPWPERLRERWHREDAQTAPTAHHIGQARDDTAVALDRRLIPAPGGDGIQPPRLLEDGVRARDLVRSSLALGRHDRGA